MHKIYPEKYQAAFNTISSRAERKGLKINDEKTQILSVSSALYDTKATLKGKNGVELYSDKTLKMLGFVFSAKPTVEAQLEHLMQKFNKRFFLLLHYKRAGLPQTRLREIHVAMTRLILEFSSNVYHSQLNKHQINELDVYKRGALEQYTAMKKHTRNYQG